MGRRKTATLLYHLQCRRRSWISHKMLRVSNATYANATFAQTEDYFNTLILVAERTTSSQTMMLTLTTKSVKSLLEYSARKHISKRFWRNLWTNSLLVYIWYLLAPLVRILLRKLLNVLINGLMIDLWKVLHVRQYMLYKFCFCIFYKKWSLFLQEKLDFQRIWIQQHQISNKMIFLSLHQNQCWPVLYVAVTSDASSLFRCCNLLFLKHLLKPEGALLTPPALV